MWKSAAILFDLLQPTDEQMGALLMQKFGYIPQERIEKKPEQPKPAPAQVPVEQERATSVEVKASDESPQQEDEVLQFLRKRKYSELIEGGLAEEIVRRFRQGDITQAALARDYETWPATIKKIVEESMIEDETETTLPSEDEREVGDSSRAMR